MGWHGGGWLDEEAARRVDPQLLRRLLAYLAPYRAHVILALLAMLLATAATVVGPYILARAIDHYVIPGHEAWRAGDFGRAERMIAGATMVAGLYLGLQLLFWLATYGQVYLMSWAAQNAIFRLRQDLFAHIQRLSLRWFDGRPAGVVMSRVTNDIESMKELISSGMIQVIGDFFILAGIMGFMLAMNWKLALLAFITLPFCVILATTFRERVINAYRKVRQKIAEIAANLQESISGVRVTQSFVREDANLARFDRTNQENFAANMQAATLWAMFWPLVEVIGAFGTAIVIWWGGQWAMREYLAGVPWELAAVSPGVIVAFIQYIDRFFWPIRNMAMIYTEIQHATAACEKIFEIMDTEPEIKDAPGAVELGAIRGEVRFEAVTFGYEPDQPVLRQLSLVAEPGQRVALVGPTGAGKTSIINLLARFYDPQQGRILVDGVDVRTVTQHSLRRQMGIVLQDTFLFSGTVLDNIRYGRLEVGEEEVVGAARAVGAHEFIMRLPEGYRTEVQERGGKLSIGQRQLVSFARALLADPRILILDEATSSVDAYTEVLIQRALERLLEGRTSFVIAHRLSTVRSADKILVVDGGRVVEEGTHEALLAAGGVYARLYETQFKYQETEAVPADD